MPKYVRLNKERTEWTTALFNVKPNPVRRHDDSILPTFDWFTVVEHKQPLPDKDLYTHQRTSWELIDDVVHITYTPTLINLEQRQRIVSERCTALRNEKLSNGLTFAGMPFDTREETYKRVLGTILKATIDPEHTTEWINQNNDRVFLSNQMIQAFGDAYARFENDLIMYCRDLKDVIEASDAPETIDITEGWPDTDYYPELAQ